MTPSCPLCGGAEAAALTRVGFIARDPYSRCRSCGFLHARPEPGSERRFYNEVYPFLAHKGREAGSRLPLFQDLLTRLLAGGPGRRLLDVGCGDGDFLRLAREAGLAPEGVELSAPLAAQAASRSGCPVLVGTVDDLPREGCFDVVTLWNVLDQVPDPLGLLRSIHTRLRPGGRLYLRVPNGSVHRLLMGLANVLGPRLTPRMVLAATPFHPHLLRPADLRRALDRAGFAPVRLQASLPTGARLRPRRALATLLRGVDRLGGERLLLMPSIEAVAVRP